MKSMRWKIVFFLLSIVLGALALTSWTIDRTLDWQFRRYLKHAYESRMEEISDDLSRAYAENGTWQTFMSSPSASLLLRSTGVIRLTDEEGQTIFEWDGSRRYRRRRLSEPLDLSRLVPINIQVNDHIVGEAWIIGPPNKISYSPKERLFRRTVRRGIILSSLFAGVLSVLVGLLGAERLTRPIHALTLAAKRLAGGDLSARTPVNSQDELGGLAGTFNHMATELETNAFLRQKTIANTAHELRTPLTTIQSHLEGMVDGVITPNNENIEVVLEEVGHLVQLSEELQSFSSIERFQHKPSRVLFDLNVFLDQTRERLLPTFQRRGIEFILNLPDSPVVISSHSQALQQILDNLLMNAAKYTPEHQGKQVVLSLSIKDFHAILRLEDQGIGIPKEDLPHIFNRFYRVDPSRSRTTGGVGLGLAIAKETAEAIDGELTVESQVSLGTTFTLALPLDKE